MAMYINETALRGLADASGLTMMEKAYVSQMVDVYCHNLAGNREKLDFYNDDVNAGRLDKKLPDSIRNIKVAPGWCSKAVNMLARRSRLDAFIADGETADMVDAICRDGNLHELYSMSAPSVLTFGGGFITIGTGYDATEPRVVFNYHDMLRAAALWDYRRSRLKCGMVIEDMYQPRAGQAFEPTYVVIHMPYAVIEMERNGSLWVAKRKRHDMGACCMVPLRFQPSAWQPFGKSRVSKACRSITRQVILETHNLIAYSQAHSLPQKTLSGLSDQQYDAIANNLVQAYSTDMMLLTNNDDGGTPVFQVHQPAGVSVHTDIIEHLAKQFASETDLPLSAFGVLSKTYTSSDALRASSDDLYILCDAWNRENGQALALAMQIALCIMQGKKLANLTDDEKHLTVKWKDPSMPSVASVADAHTKLASVVDGYGGTSVFWEKVGMSEDEIRRIKSDVLMNQGAAALNALFTGTDEEPHENPAQMD